MAKVFEVTLVRSTIGCTQDQKDTVRCLKLRKIGQTVKISDSPAMRGQIFKVQHLLNVAVGGQ